MAKLKPAVKIDPSLTNFAVMLTNMHHQAHGLGLPATGHAIHEAVKVVGFEIEHIYKKGEKPV